MYCCKDCNRREVGCHATCVDYINDKKEHDEHTDLIKRKKGEIHSFNSYHFSVLRKERAKKRR